MMRSNIDRLKQLLKKTKEYKEKFYKDRDKFFCSAEADWFREDLIKRYEELKELIIEANGGIPSTSMFGNRDVDVFANAFSSHNDVAAFHSLKVAPEYLVKAIAYHGGKKVNKIASENHKDYIKTEIIEEFRKKKGKFDYQKLTSLLEELNHNYDENNPYSSLALIRTVLDHVPPLLGESDFSRIVSNYKWGETDKKYMKQLLDIKAVADDVLHRQISGKQDLISMDDIPRPVLINVLLRECLDKGEQAKPLQKKITPKAISSKSKIKVELSKNEIHWDNYAEYEGPSFIINLRIDNYESEIPDYITNIVIQANSNDGVWQTQHFKFSGLKFDEEYKIEAHDIKNTQVYLSDNINEGLRNPRKMPDLDRDTLKLIVFTRSREKIEIKFKPGWVVG